MRGALAKGICIKNIITWSIISLGCVLAMVVFAINLFEDLASGSEIFIPGILVLVGAVLLVLILGITRILKYVKLLKDN